MELLKGAFYFVADEFFEKVNDPYLKMNYEKSKRPHYFAFYDDKTELIWLIPCSSKIEKFERIIENKNKQHKPNDTILIAKVFNKKTVLLLQDMFPVTNHYIEQAYIKGGQIVRIYDKNTIKEIDKKAHKVINLLRNGVRFTPTQLDIKKIEKLMIEELEKINQK